LSELDSGHFSNHHSPIANLEYSGVNPIGETR
jgi:hypothetical protein